MRLFIILCTLSAAPAKADHKTPLRMLTFVSAAAIHEIFVHETAHVVMALAQGATVMEYTPWPCHAEGRLRLGYYHVENLPGDDTLVRVAPYVLDVVAFVTADVALSRVKSGGWAGSLLFIAGMVAPWLNFTTNYIKGGDWAVLRNRSPAFPIVGGILIGAGALRLVTRLVRALTAETGHRPAGRASPASPRTPPG